MILQIDSNYRDFRIYPEISQFAININAESFNPLNDVRSTYISEYYAEYVFSWFGNTVCPGISKIPNDSVQIFFIPIQKDQCVIVEFIGVQNLFLKNDFLVGLLFSFNNLSSQIIGFNKTTRVVSLQDSLFSEFNPNFIFTDSFLSENTSTGFITNFSFFWNNNLTILGSSSFFPNPALEFILAEGLSTSLFVQNVTKNWTRPITSIKGRFRNAILQDIPSYSSNDFFIVWRNKSPYLFHSLHLLSFSALYRFIISNPGRSFVVGQKLHSVDYSIICTVTSINPIDGSILSLQIDVPGYDLFIGQVIILYDSNDINHCSIIVSLTSTVLRLEENNIPLFSSQSFFIAIVNPNTQSLFYLYYSLHERNLVYFNIDIIDFQYLNDIVFPYSNSFQVIFLPYHSILPSINIPRISLQEKTCYNVRLLSISLPNLPVCGFNVLLSSFPYLIVTLCNGPTLSLEDSIITNNPNAFSSNFIVPIANIKNPLIVRFVSIRSPINSTIFKLFLRDSIFFSVRIPNGELLRFKTSSSSLLCTSLNEPLNKLYSPNDRQIFVSTIDNSINAVFELIPL